MSVRLLTKKLAMLRRKQVKMVMKKNMELKLVTTRYQVALDRTFIEEFEIIAEIRKLEEAKPRVGKKGEK